MSANTLPDEKSRPRLERLWLVRHGESAGNVASRAADLAGLSVIDLGMRDVDVPLSPLGERQAHAVGLFLRGLPAIERPTSIFCSPYLRAQQTASILLDAAGIATPQLTDERLRERELGLFDGLTKRGILERYAEQATLRARVGKFYHRPPSGESWCDVIFRLRHFLDSIAGEPVHERVLVVSHQMVIMGFRYLIERLNEAQILAIDRDQPIANCSLTSYAAVGSAGGARLALKGFNHVAPLEEAGADITREHDGDVIAK